MKYRFLKAALTGLVLLGSTGAAAALITDTVTVGDYEWAQVDLFTSLSWDEINAICPSGGVCSDGDLNGNAMLGWKWADDDMVVLNLFEKVLGSLQNDIFMDGNLLETFVTATGFRLIRTIRPPIII